MTLDPVRQRLRVTTPPPGQRWRTAKPSLGSMTDALVRDALADQRAEHLFRLRFADSRCNDEASVAWAAGIFEGEGSWGCYRSKLRATIVIGDRDVLDRFAQIVGVGSVSQSTKPSNEAHRQMWRWSTSNLHVIELAVLFWPYLGDRRRAVFCEKLAERELFVQEATRLRACASCGQDFRPPYSKMASRTRYCSDVCRQRHRRKVA